MKADGHVLPAHAASPSGKEPFVLSRQLALAVGPRNPFDFHATASTHHTPHGVDENHADHPQRNEIETASGRQSIVSRTMISTLRTASLTVLTGTHGDLDR